MNTFSRGEAVAVLEIGANSPVESMSIATVGHAEANHVTLNDGRNYQQSGDQWISEDQCTYIVPATSWHISVVHNRCLQPISGMVRKRRFIRAADTADVDVRALSDDRLVDAHSVPQRNQSAAKL